MENRIKAKALPLDIFIYASETCPRCLVIETKLKAKGLNYHKITNINDAVLETLQAEGFTMLPIVSFDGEHMDFAHANQYIESM